MYQYQIDDVPFYASELDEWQANGVQPGYTSNGQPSPYGPGAFSNRLNALATSDPVNYGGEYGSSGTFRQLVGIFFDSLSANGGLQTYRTFDPRINDFITTQGRLDIIELLNSLTGGAALSGVPIKVTSAFIPDELRDAYYGGDPTPILTPSDYIPGDDLPPAAPGTFGWNIGTWNNEPWNQGGA
jgi:hypothetical protein